jgi:hypothetical protein
VKSWKEENWRGRLKMVLFALTPVTILLVLAEALTFTAIDRTFGNKKDPKTGRQTYEFHMGHFPWSHVSRTPINSLGFPDDEFANVLPKNGCTHVAFVGDSFVFGDGIDRDDNYVSLIRAEAARRFPDRCLRIFNLGERASTIEQQARNLERSWDLIEPDVVILGQYQNDLTDLTKEGFAGHVEEKGAPAQRNWTPPTVQIPLVGASIVKWLSYQTFAIMSQNNMHYDVLSRWSVLADSSNSPLALRLEKQYSDLFETELAKVRARGAKFGVTIMPSKFDVLAGRSPEEQFFVDLAKKNDVPALTLYSTFDAARKPFPFLMYDGHLNREGNQLVARTVATWLFDSDPAPFAALRAQTPVVQHAAQ